jgi:hypothetical protein
MERCKKCILPANYLNISFDANGVCSFCNSHTQKTYPGLDKMREDVRAILKKHPNRKFDCVLGISGGRDSTYLLHILKNVLGLNPLAYFVNHDFIPEHTRNNVMTIAKKADVKLIVEKSQVLRHCFHKTFKAWKKRPSPATISAFCMGCKSRVLFTDYKLAIKYKIPLIINGGTPFEYASYKMDLMKMDPESKKIRSYKMGYFHQIMKNPSLILDPYIILMQGAEYLTYINFHPTLHRLIRSFYHLSFIDPYWMYTKWEEKEVMSTIKKEFDWKNFPGMKSTWRGDCYIGPVRQYLYYALLGYSDKDVHLSSLIRDGQITREEAMNRITEENNSSISVLSACCEKAGVDINEINGIVDKYRKEHNQ